MIEEKKGCYDLEGGERLITIRQLAEHLNPMQLGFLYESLLLSASEASPDDWKRYMGLANEAFRAIDASFGWEDYIEKMQKDCQAAAAKFA